MKLQCECKNILIDWRRNSTELHCRVCSCKYCQKNKTEYISEQDSSFSFHINDSENHTMVKHGHETATFHECNNCGVSFVTCEIKGICYGIINAKVMGIKGYILDPEPRDYSGETVDERLIRRKERWSKVHS